LRLLGLWLGAAFYWMGQLMLPAGRPGRALARAFLAQALWFDPHNHRARGYLDYLLGVRQTERGEPEEGLRLLKRAAKALPEDSAVALDAGVAMTMGGEYAAAVTALTRLLSEHWLRVRGERQLWFALAWSHVRLGQYPQALKTAQEAAAASVGTVQLRLVTLLAGGALAGEMDTAAIAGLLRTTPGLIASILEFTEQLATAGQPALADQLVAVLPADVQRRGLQLVAASAMNRGAPQAARWALDQQAARGEDARYLVLKSELHLQEGDLPGALAAAEQAAEKSQGRDAAAQEQWGEVLLLMGREEEAFPHFVEALGHGSLSALAGGVVAMRLLEQGKPDGAKQVFRVSRTGAELGCAWAHAATAWIQADNDEVGESLELAERAWAELLGLPAWAAQPATRRRLLTLLQGIVKRLEETARQREKDEWAARAAKLRRKLEGALRDED
jgi:tetratricopeptide (TPR) repeat protein